MSYTESFQSSCNKFWVVFFILKGLDWWIMVLVLLVLCLRVHRYWDCLVLSLLITNQQMLKSAQDKTMKFHMLLSDNATSAPTAFLVASKNQSVLHLQECMQQLNECSFQMFCKALLPLCLLQGWTNSCHLHAPLKLCIAPTRLRLIAEAKGSTFKQCLRFVLFFHLTFGLAFIVASSVVLQGIICNANFYNPCFLTEKFRFVAGEN